MNVIFCCHLKKKTPLTETTFMTFSDGRYVVQLGDVLSTPYKPTSG